MDNKDFISILEFEIFYLILSYTNAINILYCFLIICLPLFSFVADRFNYGGAIFSDVEITNYGNYDTNKGFRQGSDSMTLKPIWTSLIVLLVILVFCYPNLLLKWGKEMVYYFKLPP